MWYGGTFAYDDDDYPEYLREVEGLTVSGTGTQTVDYKTNEDIYGGSYLLSLTLGCILLAILVIDLIRSVLPQGLLDTAPFVRSLVTPASVKAEASQKKASFQKVSRMVQNALAVHSTANASHRTASMKLSKSSHESFGSDDNSQFQAMLAFQSQASDTEEVGGLLWTWKQIFSGSLFLEEGVWIHSRLLAITMAQVLVVRS